MTTSINSVNAGTAAATDTAAKKSSLTESTKEKLEELGITATDDMTEAEAIALIQAAQAQNMAQNGGGEQNSTESEILAEAKTLAAQMGVPVSDDAEVDEILDDIGEELEIMLDEAEKNPNILGAISEFFSKLTSLDTRYDTLQSSIAGMFNAMEMVSTSNKITHGLT